MRTQPIRVVANRTGIGPHTLRVWERRYGFPSPERREGGVREYSEGDIARLTLIARALAAGFRAGEVVPLGMEDLTKLLAATPPSNAAEPATAAAPEVPPKETLRRVLEALRADEIVLVQSTLREAASGIGAKRFVTEIAHPLALKVGELWARRKLDVRHEHLVSACLTRQLHALAPDDSAVERWPVVVLATLPGERHVLPLEMIAVYLAASGAAPRMLGADSPPLEIAAATVAMKADAVGLSISAVADRATATAAIRDLLGDLPRRTDVWLGGAGASAIASELEPEVALIDSFAAIDAKLGAMRASRAA